MAYSTYLITGITGSFGQAMTRYLLQHTRATIRGLSRDELKQAQMRETFADDLGRLTLMLGDVRDRDRLQLALRGVDCVFHAAALKHVPLGERDPAEFIRTNIQGTEHVIRACIDQHVQQAILLSTDKAVAPINLYGCTKAVAERLWLRANGYAPHGTAFAALRYGNVTGSRGSVFGVWARALAEGRPLPLTDPAMTRFWITLDEAVQFAAFAAAQAPRGWLLVPVLPAYTLPDLAHAVTGDAAPAMQTLGIRPGEKLHEALMTAQEGAHALSYRHSDGTTYYAVPPVDPSWRPASPEQTAGWQAAPLAVPYTSDTWPRRLTAAGLRERLAHA